MSFHSLAGDHSKIQGPPHFRLPDRKQSAILHVFRRFPKKVFPAKTGFQNSPIPENKTNLTNETMNRIALAIICAEILGLSACSFTGNHLKNNRLFGVTADCREPAKDQLENGYLTLQDGKTLKCQLGHYVSNMDCDGIVDKNGKNLILCKGRDGTAAFLFDEQNVLISHKITPSRNRQAPPHQQPEKE